MEHLKKIVDLINSRNAQDQKVGKDLIALLTLSEAYEICNTAIKDRGIRDLRFLFDLFDPRTYPKMKSGHVLLWNNLGEWAASNPNQKSLRRQDRKFDLEVGKNYRVCKVAPCSDIIYENDKKIKALYGKFVKETKHFYAFDTFKVGRVTLMSIESYPRTK